jgi:two-component system, OmpR family, KDP operon response regulator KdpE
MKLARVLVVDDEEQIRRAIGRALTSRDYVVDLAADGEEALRIAKETEPDLVILDLNMPRLDGLSTCRELRGRSQVPILILSVREEEADKVAALDLGADDYLTKPFGTDELMARVRALLRRAGASGASEGIRFRTAELEIDLDAHLVRREGNGVHLTKTEWALLGELSRHPGKLLTHRWLLERVWGAGYGDDVDVLRVFVSQLRRKIETEPSRPKVIATEPGIGYRWLIQPVALDEGRDLADQG